MIGGAISVILLALIIYIAARNPNIFTRKTTRESERKQEDKEPTPLSAPPPSTMSTSVSKEDAQKAEEDLRILSVEKEIVSYALTRLYEAQAEGKITEKDKERLLGKYKDEMGALEKRMNDKQMVVRLHELETTQADLVKLFQEKFEEINRNIGSIRASLGLGPQLQPKEADTKKEPPTSEEKPKETSSEVAQETKEKPAPKPRTPKKLEAEEKVEAIQQEVLKILERLEKQEAEG